MFWKKKKLTKKAAASGAVAPNKKENGLGDTALFGFARYVRIPGTAHEVLRPRWRILTPVLIATSLSIYAAIATGKYCLDRYYYDLRETPYWDMYIYVVPNRVPYTSYVFLPEFLNRYVMAARERQQLRMSKMLMKNPQNIHELLWAAKTQPSNIELQFQAAYFLASSEWFNRVNDAFAVLEHTLPYMFAEKETLAYNLLRYTRVCFQYEQDARIIRTYKEVVDKKDVPVEAVNHLAVAAAEAYYLLGDFESAEQTLRKHNQLESLQGILLEARMFWENGENERALGFLRHFIGLIREGREKLFMQLAKFQNEMGQSAEAAATLGRIIELNPDDAAPRLQQLGTLDGDAAKGQRESAIETYVAKFATSEAALLALGGYAAEKGNVELQERLEKLAVQGHFPKLASFRFLLIETLITADRHGEALELISELFLRRPEWLRKNQVMETQFECLRMLCSFAEKKPESARAALHEILRKDLSIPVMVATARRLQKLGYHDEARRILLSAYIRNNRHQGVLLELVKMDLKNETSSETLGEHLANLLEGRRPPRYVLQKAYQHFGSDRFLFVVGRDELLDRMDNMLRTRHLPRTELEKGLPEYPESQPITPLPLENPRHALHKAYQYLESDRLLFTDGSDDLIDKMNHMLRRASHPLRAEIGNSSSEFPESSAGYLSIAGEVTETTRPEWGLSQGRLSGGRSAN